MEDPTASNATPPANSSPHLSPPPSMSTPIISLESRINRLINANQSPSPSRSIYSDRFIPSRSGSNYALFDLAKDGKEDGAGSYATLLRAAMFGPETPEKRDITGFSTSRNIFRFKTETNRCSDSFSPFVSDDGPGVSQSPIKALRKGASSSYTLPNHGFVTASCLALNTLSSMGSTATMISCMALSSLPYMVDAQPTRTENECTGNTAYTIVIQTTAISYTPATTLPMGSVECDYNRDRTYGTPECTWANQVTPAPEIDTFSWGNETNSYYGSLFGGGYRSLSHTELWGQFNFRTYDKNITKLEYALGTTNSSINDLVDWTVSDLSLFTNGGSVSYATGIPNTATLVYGGWYMKQGVTLPDGEIYPSFRLTTSDGVLQAVETFVTPLKIYTA